MGQDDLPGAPSGCPEAHFVPLLELIFGHHFGHFAAGAHFRLHVSSFWASREFIFVLHGLLELILGPPGDHFGFPGALGAHLGPPETF